MLDHKEDCEKVDNFVMLNSYADKSNNSAYSWDDTYQQAKSRSGSLTKQI